MGDNTKKTKDNIKIKTTTQLIRGALVFDLNTRHKSKYPASQPISIDVITPNGNQRPSLPSRRNNQHDPPTPTLTPRSPASSAPSPTPPPTTTTNSTDIPVCHPTSQTKMPNPAQL